MRKMGISGFNRTNFCMEGRCHGIPCFHLLFFLFRSDGKKECLDENTFRHGYGNHFKTAVLKVTWFQLCSKFFLNNYEVHCKWHLKDTFQRFFDIAQFHCYPVLNKYWRNYCVVEFTNFSEKTTLFIRYNLVSDNSIPLFML